MDSQFCTLVTFIRVELWVIFCAFVFVVVIKMASGEILLSGILSDKSTGAISPSRVQSLILTFTVAAAIMSGEMFLPENSNIAATIFGGSQFFYLYTKSKSKSI